MIKVSYIISNIDKAVSFEWIYDTLKNEFFISFIFLASSFPKTATYIEHNGGKVDFIVFKNKSDYPKTAYKLAKILKENKPDIVHTHLRDADLLGLSISKLLGIKNRVTTRHFSTFNRDFHPKSIKYDKLINRLATKIIAISENVNDVLREEGIKESKISLIHHGFDLDKFEMLNTTNINALKEKYQTTGHFPVIGVISRYIKWKGHQYIIEAFNDLLKEYPRAKLILANANGPFKTEIQNQLKNFPEGSFVEIPFEPDLYSLYQLFDVFVHTPIDDRIEAFGQIYVEALAAGIPSIFTLSGVAHEFIKHKKNALVVAYKNAEQINLAIHLIIKEKDLKERIISNGKRSLDIFRLNMFIEQLKRLYLDLHQ